MKKIYLSFLVSVIVLSACSSSKVENNYSVDPIQKDLSAASTKAPEGEMQTDLAACFAECESYYPCKIDCYRDATEKTGDPKYCKEIFNLEPNEDLGQLFQYESCLEGSKSTDLSYCEPLSETSKYECIADSAVRAKDAAMCFSEESINYQAKCIERVATRLGDESICQVLLNIKGYSATEIEECKISVKMGASTLQSELSQLNSVSTEIQQKCSPLKTADGNNLITTSDAENILGGSWSFYDSDFITSDNDIGILNSDPYCLYIINNDQGGQVNLQAISVDSFATSSRSIADLGERASISDPSQLGMMLDENGERSAILEIQKNDRVLAIGCWTTQTKRCSEKDLLEIGKIAADRWK